MDWQELDKRVGCFGKNLPRSNQEGIHFRTFWDEIKAISASFKQTRYPTTEQRQSSWNQFQQAVASLKLIQEEHFAHLDETKGQSEKCKHEILAKAESAMPGNAFAEGLAMPFLAPIYLAKGLMNALLPGPPIDEEREELRQRSELLKEGWRLLGEYKVRMTGADKNEVFHALKESQERLQEAWDQWKSSRAVTYEARREAKGERNQERRSEQVDRIKENIRKNEERLEKSTAALAKCERHLEELREKASSAWNDDFRSRVEGWISEEEDRIDSIKDSIREIEDWIEEGRRRLGGL